MKIATSIVAVTLTLAIAADAATRYVDENGQSLWVESAIQVPEKYRNKDNSVTRPDMRAIKEKNDTTMETRDPKIQGKQSPADFKRSEESGRGIGLDKSGATTTYPLQYHDKLVRQQARENKINALNRRCDGDNSALCRKHNDRQAEKYLDDLEKEN